MRWHLGERRGAAVRAGDCRGGHNGRHASQRIQRAFQNPAQANELRTEPVLLV